MKQLSRRWDGWIVSGICLNLILKTIWFYSVAIEQNIYGDEAIYGKFAALLCLATNFREFGDVVLLSKHFMPGMSILICVFRDLGVAPEMVRFSLMTVETSLFIIATILLSSIKGKRLTRFFVFLVSLSPMLISFSFNFWGDLIVGWLWLIAFLGSYRLVDHTLSPAKWFGGFVGVGCVWGLSMYFRPSMLLLGPLSWAVVAFCLYMRQEPRVWLSWIRKAGLCAFALIVGWGATWGPWIIGTSIHDKQFVYGPGQDLTQRGEWIRWNIWAHSPEDSEWGYRRGKRFKNDLTLKIEQNNGDEFAALTQMHNEIIAHSNPVSLLAAWSRNVTNIVCNENQFLAGAMQSSGIKSSSTPGFPAVKLKSTRGGHQVKTNYAPAGMAAKSVLLFNSFWYYSLLLLAFLWIFSSSKNGVSGNEWFYFFLANCAGVLSMTLYHPGHGRYVFSLLPSLVLTGSYGLEHISTNTITYCKQRIHPCDRIHLLVVFLLFVVGMICFIFKP